jgi:hypothetical protein
MRHYIEMALNEISAKNITKRLKHSLLCEDLGIRNLTWKLIIFEGIDVWSERKKRILGMDCSARRRWMLI